MDGLLLVSKLDERDAFIARHTEFQKRVKGNSHDNDIRVIHFSSSFFLYFLHLQEGERQTDRHIIFRYDVLGAFNVNQINK